MCTDGRILRLQHLQFFCPFGKNSIDAYSNMNISATIPAFPKMSITCCIVYSPFKFKIYLYKEQKRSTTVVKEKKIGRNEPCPCGSGKKYKNCCGK